MWHCLLLPAVTGAAEQMQISELAGPMLAALPADAKTLNPNPRPFGGVGNLLRSVKRAGFLDVVQRWLIAANSFFSFFDESLGYCYTAERLSDG